LAILIVIAVLFALMWILFIRPQKRRQLAQQQLIKELEPGAEILTAGGLYGTVRSVDGDELTVEIAPGTNVRLARRAVAGIIPPEDEEEHPQLAAGTQAGERPS
jgi:preprotein translocase subunit YajC